MISQSEQTDAGYEAIELSLAHAVGNAVERAYFRADLLEKRRRVNAGMGRLPDRNGHLVTRGITAVEGGVDTPPFYMVVVCKCIWCVNPLCLCSPSGMVVIHNSLWCVNPPEYCASTPANPCGLARVALYFPQWPKQSEKGGQTWRLKRWINFCEGQTSSP